MNIRMNLHMNTVGYDGQDGDTVDKDNLDNCWSGSSLHVDRRGAADGLQPVHRNPSQAQGGDVDGDSLKII